MLILERIKKNPKKEKSIVEKTTENPQVDPQAQPSVATSKVQSAVEMPQVKRPTEQQIEENNKMIGGTKRPQVDSSFVKPTHNQFGAALTPEMAQEIMANGGTIALWDAINKPTAFEGQDAIDKREKKEKQRALVTSIADGLSSIANLGGAMAGGISQNLSSLSEANTKRREYQRQLRDKDRDKWQAMMLRAGEVQQNYELAKDKQALMNEKRLGDIRIKEMEIALKSAKTQGDIDRIHATIEKIYADIDRREKEYDLKVSQFNELVNKNKWQEEVGFIKAGASKTSAEASQQRAEAAANKPSNPSTPSTPNPSMFSPNINGPQNANTNSPTPPQPTSAQPGSYPGKINKSKNNLGTSR